MTKRAELKVKSRNRIVDAAAKRFLMEGMEGATISKVLGDAGLTHGTFYAHFEFEGSITRRSLSNGSGGNFRTLDLGSFGSFDE